MPTPGDKTQTPFRDFAFNVGVSYTFTTPTSPFVQVVSCWPMWLEIPRLQMWLEERNFIVSDESCRCEHLGSHLGNALGIDFTFGVFVFVCFHLKCRRETSSLQLWALFPPQLWLGADHTIAPTLWWGASVNWRFQPTQIGLERDTAMLDLWNCLNNRDVCFATSQFSPESSCQRWGTM